MEIILTLLCDSEIYWNKQRKWLEFESFRGRKTNKQKLTIAVETRVLPIEAEAVPLVKFMYLVFTGMPGESYRRRFRSLF